MAARIFREELGGAGFPLENVDFHQAIRDAELGERETHLVAIARALHRIERIHSRPRLRSGVSLRSPPDGSLKRKWRPLQGRHCRFARQIRAYFMMHCTRMTKFC